VGSGLSAIKTYAHPLDAALDEPTGNGSVHECSIRRHGNPGKETSAFVHDIEEVLAHKWLAAGEDKNRIGCFADTAGDLYYFIGRELAFNKVLLCLGTTVLTLEVAARGQLPENQSQTVLHDSSPHLHSLFLHGTSLNCRGPAFAEGYGLAGEDENRLSRFAFLSEDEDDSVFQAERSMHHCPAGHDRPQPESPIPEHHLLSQIAASRAQ
jgi:hypothetical protein